MSEAPSRPIEMRSDGTPSATHSASRRTYGLSRSTIAGSRRKTTCAVVPRTRLPEILAGIYEIGAKYRLRLSNVFHAGDGNLHPLVLFDGRVPGEEKLAEEVSGEILRICLRYGGSITGEHGVGFDKAPYMAEMFTEDDLETMSRVRCAFDPLASFNPGKVFPTPRLCGDRPGVYKAHPAEVSGEAHRV